MIVKSQPPMWRQRLGCPSESLPLSEVDGPKASAPCPGGDGHPCPVSPSAFPPDVTSVISTAYHFGRTLKGIPLTRRFSKRFPTLESQETQPQLLYRRTIRPCYSFSRK